MFAHWGLLVDRHPWRLLGFALLVLVVSVLGLVRGGDLRSPRSLNLEAGLAADQADRELPHPAQADVSSFTLVFTSPTLKTADRGFEDAVNQALVGLRADGRVQGVRTPFNAAPADAPGLITRDGRTALAFVALKDDYLAAQKYYQALRDKVHSSSLKVLATDGVAVNHAFNAYLENDIQRAEVFSIPLTIVFLLLVFGAVVAAGLPLGVGLLSIVGGVGGVVCLAQ